MPSTSSDPMQFLNEANLLKIELDKVHATSKKAALIGDLDTLKGCSEAMEAIHRDMLDVRRRQIEASMPKPRRRWFRRSGDRV